MLLTNLFVKRGSVQQVKRKMKRGKNANESTHKLPLIHEKQFLYTMQEECTSTLIFSLTNRQA